MISGEASSNICSACGEQNPNPLPRTTINSFNASHVTKFVARLVAMPQAFFTEANEKRGSNTSL